MNKIVEQLEARIDQLGNARTREMADLLFELSWNIGFGGLDRAFHVNAQALAIAREVGYSAGEALARRNLGFIYYARAEYKAGLENSNAALAAFEESGDLDQQANVLGIIGLTYWSLGNFDLTVDYLTRSEKLFRQTNNTHRLPWILTSLGGVYENLRDLDRAFSYHNRSLRHFRRHQDVLGEARALSGIGLVHRDRRDYRKALKFMQQSLALFRKVDNKLGLAREYNDMGLAYQELGELETALDYHRKSLEIRQQLGNRHAEITSLLNLGRLFNAMNEPARALEVLGQAQSAAEGIDVKPKLYKIHQALAHSFELAGDLKQALNHLRAYQEIKEVVLGDETKLRLKNMQIQFEVERSEAEAEIHRLRHVELKKAFDDLKAAEAYLIESEKMAALGHLTAGIAHEINNPIGAVKSAADLSLRGLEKIRKSLAETDCAGNGTFASFFAKTVRVLEENSRMTMVAVERVSAIVKSLKNFARLDEAERKRVDLHEGLESTLTLIRHEMPPGVQVRKEFGDLPQMTVFPNQLNQAFMTILRNAFQAFDGPGEVRITTRMERESAIIEIADTGRGMSPEMKDSLFALTFTTKQTRVGLGFGLYNARDIMLRHGGQLEVESEVGKGSVFRMILPVAQELVSVDYANA